MVDFLPYNTARAVTVNRADNGGDEPAFELDRRGGLVKVEYLYSAFTGWVRAERVGPRRWSGKVLGEGEFEAVPR